MRKSMILAVVAISATARAQEAQDGQQQWDAGDRIAQAQQGDAGSDRAAPQQQGGGGQADLRAPTGPSSDAFDRACVDLLHGKTPQGERAIKTLRDACASLMSGRADERIDAEKRRQQQLAAQEQLRLQAEGRANPASPAQPGSVEPGQATAQPQPGTGVLAAFGVAASELGSSSRRTTAMGMRSGGPVGYSVVTNPFGYFNGLGANAEIYGAIGGAPKFSWVGGARYSRTDASNGTASTFGALGGVDWFIVGRNNEGFRVGPRVEVAAGREDFQGGTTFARMGLGGELGYNFIASNGITGLAAAGLGGRVAGDSQNDDFASFVGGEFGPYAKIAVGFSW